MDRKQELARLAERYPLYMPLTAAAILLGVSSRQLSKLIAEGREPFASLGANIGLKQNYVCIYTNRLMRYLAAEDLGANIPDE